MVNKHLFITFDSGNKREQSVISAARYIENATATWKNPFAISEGITLQKIYGI